MSSLLHCEILTACIRTSQPENASELNDSGWRRAVYNSKTKRLTLREVRPRESQLNKHENPTTIV